MILTFNQLSKKTRIFKKLTGLSILQFNNILNKVKGRFTKEFPKIGRKSKINQHKDRLLLILLYYRTYVTHEFIGYFVGLHETNICRLFARIEPLIAKCIHIKKCKRLTEKEVHRLLIDATEQPIQRPKKKSKRKLYYSGKKKRHTHKTELVMDQDGRIIQISKTQPGSVHDLTIRKSEKALPAYTQKYCDLGYQGLQHVSNNVYLPHKKPKGKQLTEQQKQENKSHSQIRIAVEHKFSSLKKFRILGEVYRNFGKKHHLRFNIIAGIVNLQAGF